VALHQQDRPFLEREFANSAPDYKQLTALPFENNVDGVIDKKTFS
jgi:hypothetical protein